MVGLLLLFGIPIGAVILLIFLPLRGDSDRPSQDGLRRVAIFAALTLLSLVGVAALFTASAAGAGQYEFAVRLHMRYYNFAFPLLLIVAGALVVPREDNKRSWRLGAAVRIGCAIAYAIYTRLSPFAPMFFDSPELRGITADRHALLGFGALSLVALALWVYSTSIGVRAFLFGILPAATIVQGYFVNKDIRVRLKPDADDNAGLFVQRFLTRSDRDKLIALGPDIASLYRTVFQADSWGAMTGVRADDHTPATLPAAAGRQSMLIIGTTPALPDDLAVMRMPGFIFARSVTGVDIDLGSHLPLAIIDAIGGLSDPKFGMRLSVGQIVTITFGAALPHRFEVELTALAIGPNIGKAFTARVGDDIASFVLSERLEKRKLMFENASRAHTLTIELPEPVSLSEPALNGDLEKIRIALKSLKITAID